MSFAQWSQNRPTPPTPPPGPVPPTGLPWHRRTRWVVAGLVLLPPLGWVLAGLKREWSLKRRIVVIVASVVWFIIALAMGGDGKESDAEESAKGTSPSARTDAGAVSTTKVPDFVGDVLKDAKSSAADVGFSRVTSHDASEGNSGQWADSNWTVCFQAPAAGKKVDDPATARIDLAVVRTGAPCPEADGEAIPYPKLPNVINKTYRAATEQIEKLGISDINAAGAYVDITVARDPAEWTVCFQTPEAGTKVTSPETMSVDLALVSPDDPCPPNEHTERHPAPDPDPTPAPDHESDPTNGTGSGTGTGHSDDSDDSGSAYYPNCTAVRAAGKAPLHSGEPGYSRSLDRDGDGIACDQ
ncbi:excalibur calcium-binding domain-containing protein [Streptomyces sp. NPDC059063]|uniref:excalibur calcium-binding domain-containing protein n=1 Tax=unclassified Streptomyces TaxID=2593676 RepID=UPI0036C6D81E